MTSLPTVAFDPGRARAWLSEPNRHDPAETNAARCGVFVDDDGTCWRPRTPSTRRSSR